MKVIDSVRFSQLNGCVGIVISEDPFTGKLKGNIGIVAGSNEKADQEIILAFGGKFSHAIAKRLEQALRPKKK